MTGALLLTLAFWAKSHLTRRRQIVFALLWIGLGALPAHQLFVINPGLTNSRVLYFSSVGLVILLAALLTGIDDLRTRRFALPALSAVFAMGLLHNLNAWRGPAGFHVSSSWSCEK